MTTTAETWTVETNDGEVLATGLTEAAAEEWTRECGWLTSSEMILRRES